MGLGFVLIVRRDRIHIVRSGGKKKGRGRGGPFRYLRAYDNLIRRKDFLCVKTQSLLAYWTIYHIGTKTISKQHGLRYHRRDIKKSPGRCSTSFLKYDKLMWMLSDKGR